MDILKIENNKIALIKYDVIIREEYWSKEYTDQKLYLTESEWKEWSEQQIAKHKRYSLIDYKEIDISNYAWSEGFDLSNELDPLLIAKEMVKYNSYEEYKASLPQNQALYQLDLDYRLSKIELGI